MSSRRSARASAAKKRLSYREDSEDENGVHDLTEDEYQQQDRASTSADEALQDDAAEEQSQEDEDEKHSRRSAKRRKKTNPHSTPAKRASSQQGEEWEPGVTRVVMKLVGAPQTGHVAHGELSPNVLEFLTNLQANNDRDWFARHDAVYRYCWKNVGEFADAVLNDIMEQVDDTVPWLPTKDLVYRIYRDVRFSNDKTPYKTNFMASFSRGGRKGPFAGYHVLIKPRGQSFFAAGRWQPEKEHLALLRQHILDNTPQARALKAAVQHPNFVKWFGAPKPESNSKTNTKSKSQKALQQRCNLWGGNDELKVAPKIPGVDKTHKDIHWLKLRSFCVLHHFSDAEVVRKDFRKRLVEVAKASEPLVRILNSITSPDPLPPPASDDEAEEDADGDAEVHGRQNGTHVGNVTEEEEELLPTESFDYVDSDVADDDNDSEQDVSSSDQM